MAGSPADSGDNAVGLPAGRNERGPPPADGVESGRQQDHGLMRARGCALLAAPLPRDGWLNLSEESVLSVVRNAAHGGGPRRARCVDAIPIGKGGSQGPGDGRGGPGRFE